MDVGIVVHGPEIIDSGFAEKIFAILKNLDENINLQIKLGGTIGRIAVIDNNLENIIDISEKLVPSKSLKKLENNDVLLLLNYGKSKITGHTFGKIVVERANLNKPVIQVERPGEKDGTILLWGNKNFDFENDEEILKILETLSKHLSLSFETCISDGLNFWTEENMCFRKINGVDVNESIMLNGIIIGKSIQNEVVIVSENGKIVDIIGGNVKWHGVEKLGDIDLQKVVIKTGILRKNPSKSFDGPKYNLNSEIGELVFINHAGEDTLEFIKDKKISAALTVGDDTTTVCGDILARFGIKIIGITDGDKDDILKNPVVFPGSVVFLIKNQKDDDVGDLIHSELRYKNLESFEYYVENIKEIMNKNNIDFEEIRY